uniref:MBL fold metallo-hydrolase n=1 Tax=Spirosoma sp. TaxID=1899569 RepID=UPI003B3B76D1
MKWILVALLWLTVLVSSGASAQQIGKPLPVWREGELDIHHINTGQGNATFMVFPEGTTLLVDAGAINSMDWRTNKPRNIPVKPNNDRQAGEWIARYIRKALRFQNNPALDYVIITHFHDDHMGTPLNVAKRSSGGYVLAGITEVGEYIPIRKIMDRGWPNYAYPRSMEND